MTRLTRDDIIAGAGRRFATHGYHGTSMRDLGEDLGILGSSLYAHVGGKQELLVAVIERGAKFFEASAARALAADLPPDETLALLIAGHLDVVLDHRAEARTYVSETSFLDAGERAKVSVARDRYEGVFVDAIRRGVDLGVFDRARDPRVSAIYVLSILNTIDRWYDDAGRIDRHNLAADVHAFVRNGLATRAED
jgi:TetR/AcrR family transcriptional regulator, cholesterol catabolism regulator